MQGIAEKNTDVAVDTNDSKLKYRIESILAAFSRERRAAIRTSIATQIGVSYRTFDRWVTIKATDKKEIPYSALCIISRRLGLAEVAELINE